MRFVALLACIAGTLAAQTLVVEGADGKAVTLSAGDIAKLTKHEIEVEDHGSPARFTAVLLDDILAKVQRPTGDKYHGSSAAHYMLVEAADGYRAVYAWAELDSGFTDRKIYLALARDGKPLAASAAPWQLIAPGEKRGARWVRQVTALRIKSAK